MAVLPNVPPIKRLLRATIGLASSLLSGALLLGLVAVIAPQEVAAVAPGMFSALNIDWSGATLPSAALPAFTGDVTSPAGSPVTPAIPVADLNNLGTNVGAALILSLDAPGGLASHVNVAATYAPIASPALTGAPTAPTQTTSDTSTDLATDAFTHNAIAAAIITFGGQTVAPGATAAVQGNGAKIQLAAGSTTTSHCADFDANGNVIDAGVPCGGSASHAISNKTIASPTAPNSTTLFTMQGLAGTITPLSSGIIHITIDGTIVMPGSVGIGTGVNLQISYGTGTAPTSNAALTGTQVCSVKTWKEPGSGFTNTAVAVPFSASCYVSGLTVSTAYWIDLAAESVATASAVGFSAVNISAGEL